MTPPPPVGSSTTECAPGAKRRRVGEAYHHPVRERGAEVAAAFLFSLLCSFFSLSPFWQQPRGHKEACARGEVWPGRRLRPGEEAG